MFNVFTVTFYVPGTAAGDWAASWVAPFDCQLIHVSACCSDANGAGIEVGDDSDADEYLAKFTAGVSGTPVEKDGDDFLDSDGNSHSKYYPHIDDGDVVKVTVDHDYNGGGSSADSDDICVVLTFCQG
jgi:hypothetical protein